MSVLNVAKDIALNSPKYTKIIEPFGDSGTFAEYLAKKKPKEHVVNYEDEARFNEMFFIKNITGTDKKNLKGLDWIGSQETFDEAVSITATEGIDFYYRKTYLRHFSVRQLDPEAAPLFDWLKFGMDVKQRAIGSIPILKGLLKKVTLTNDDSISAMNQSGDFYIFAPKTPEQIEAVENKIKTLSANYFYAKRSKNNEELSEAIDKFEKVSNLTASTIMGATIQVVTNYENKLNNLAELKEESSV